MGGEGSRSLPGAGAQVVTVSSEYNRGHGLSFLAAAKKYGVYLRKANQPMKPSSNFASLLWCLTVIMVSQLFLLDASARDMHKKSRWQIKTFKERQAARGGEGILAKRQERRKQARAAKKASRQTAAAPAKGKTPPNKATSTNKPRTTPKGTLREKRVVMGKRGAGSTRRKRTSVVLEPLFGDDPAKHHHLPE